MGTIIHQDNDKIIIHHGILLDQYNGGFTFGFRVDGKNYIWNCQYDYWKLII